MKRKNMVITILVCVSVLFMTGYVFADDWQTSGDDIYYDSGNVGIGTSSPGAKLHIKDTTTGTIVYTLGLNRQNSDTYGLRVGIDSSQRTVIASENANIRLGHEYSGTFYDTMVITGNGTTIGNVGIGTTSPDGKLHVVGDIYTGDVGSNLGLYMPYALATAMPSSSVKSIIGTVQSASGYTSGSLVYQPRTGVNADHLFFTEGVERVRIDQSGNVGIGTTSPQSELAVNGTITSMEVIVTETGWSDFVFEDNYNLPSLDKVESYIKKNKHLQDIPTAKEVKEQGLGVAEMMVKQMQKIEELTLYVIEMKKENESLKRRIAILETKI